MTSKVLATGILLILVVSCKSNADVNSVDSDNVSDPDIYEVQDVLKEAEEDEVVSDFLDPDNEVPDVQYDENEALDEDDADSSVQDIDQDSFIEDLFSDEYPDEDYAIVITSDCEVSDDCVLDNSWLQPEKSWDSWAYMKAVGTIGDHACGNFGYKVKIFKDPKESDSISISNQTGGMYVYGRNNTTLGLCYSGNDPKAITWHYMYRTIKLNLSFSADLIPNMKESEVKETDFGPGLLLQQSFLYETSGYSGTHVQYSKLCTIGIPKFNNDLPVGNMYGCFGDNIDGSAGENLKIMFKMEIEDDRDKIIEYTNTKSDGSVAVPGDEDFKPYCFCSYDEKKQKLICYNYDGVKEYYEEQSLWCF